MRFETLIYSLLTGLLVLACQTSAKSKLSNLDKVQIGMDKAQVLGITGFGPRYSDRKSGQDRWIFEIYPERTESESVQKEVRFQDGKVVYVGAVQKPAISAADQDKINDTAKNDNVSIDETLKHEARKHSVDLKEELSKDMPAQPHFEEIKSNDQGSSQ